jgi:hypothetical protein
MATWRSWIIVRHFMGRDDIGAIVFIAHACLA